jgi:hypothetical protein
MRYLITLLLALSVSMTFVNEISAGPTASYPEKLNSLKPEELRGITDSILLEGNLLALYERAAWIAGDMFQTQDSATINKFGGYLVYHDENGDVRVVFADGTQDNLVCIYDVTFYDNPDNPMAESTIERTFTNYEEQLWRVRDTLIEQIMKLDAEIQQYEEFPLNHILFPTHFGYRFYYISGTSQNAVIPFGNDYFFDADEEGNVTYWRKIHSRLIAQPMEYEGNPVREVTHSHLLSEPFITPSDVCTFQLYAPFGGISKLRILSSALNIYFIYDWAENTITTEKAD